jgi:flavodoxin
MIPEKITARLPGAVFLVAVATSALGSFSCASRSTDAISTATTALSIPAESPGERRVLVILAASSAGSTAKVARAIADELDARVTGPEQAPVEHLDDYVLIGFGSGIFDGKHHEALLALADGLPPAPHAKAFLFSTCGIPARFANPEVLADHTRENHAALREKLLAKGYEIVGEFGSLGFNDNSFLKIFGGLNRGRPNADDLGNATSFAKGLERYLSSPATGGNR